MSLPEQLAAMGGFAALGLTQELGTIAAPLKRRQAALMRYQVLREDYEDHVARRVRQVYNDEEVTKGMERWVDTAGIINPAHDITWALACVYKRGAQREFAAETETERNKLDDAWSAIHKLTRTDQVGKTINRFAYGIGPVATYVTITASGRPTIDYVEPHRYEVIFDPSDPLGRPVEVIFDLRPGFRLYGEARRELDETVPAFAVVDRETWRYLNTKGEPVAGPSGETVLEHGITDRNGDPIAPVSFFRVDEPEKSDWWTSTRGERMYKATIVGGVLWCRLRYVRQYQDCMALVATIHDEARIAEGGVIGHPAKPVHITGQSAQASKIEAIEYSLNPDAIMREINAVISAAALGQGLPPEAVTLSTPLDAGRMQGTRLNSTSVTDGMRAQHRNDQIPYALQWENEIAELLVDTLTQAGNKLASGLPPVGEIAARHLVEYAELTTIDDPQQAREQADWDVKHGIKSLVDLAIARYPGTSRHKALALITRNQDENAQVWEIQATRNQPTDPEALANVPPGTIQSPAQINGSQGPRVRDGDQDDGSSSPE